MAELQSTNVTGTLCVNGVAIGGGKDVKYCCITASTNFTPSQDLVDGDAFVEHHIVGGGGGAGAFYGVGKGGFSGNSPNCVCFCQTCNTNFRGCGAAFCKGRTCITATDACCVVVGTGASAAQATGLTTQCPLGKCTDGYNGYCYMDDYTASVVITAPTNGGNSCFGNICAQGGKSGKACVRVEGRSSHWGQVFSGTYNYVEDCTTDTTHGALGANNFQSLDDVFQSNFCTISQNGYCTVQMKWGRQLNVGNDLQWGNVSFFPTMSVSGGMLQASNIGGSCNLSAAGCPGYGDEAGIMYCGQAAGATRGSSYLARKELDDSTVIGQNATTDVYRCRGYIGYACGAGGMQDFFCYTNNIGNVFSHFITSGSDGTDGIVVLKWAE